MTAFGIANVLLLAYVVWVIWERRFTFGSRFDSPITIGAVLFGVGVGLTTPWPVVAGVQFPLTGMYLALIVIGQFCFMAAISFGIKAVYMRLLPDEAMHPFIKRRIAPLVAVGSVALVICFVGSWPLTVTGPVDHQTFGSLDGWLAVSWLVYFGILAVLGLILSYGVAKLRDLVRTGGGIDDPSGGVFDGAADAFPVRWPRWLRPAQERQEGLDAGSNRTVPADDRAGCSGPL